MQSLPRKARLSVQALRLCHLHQDGGTFRVLSTCEMVNMPGKKKQQKQKFGERTEVRRNRSIDALAEFDLFDQSILPELKKMVLENWSPDRIRRAFAPLMQAQMIQKGLRGEYKAIKDTLDRHEGTAIQRMESKTVYASMSKQELAALALQKLKDAKIIDTTGRVIRELPSDDDEK